MESQIVQIEAPYKLRVSLELIDPDNITSSQIFAKTLHTALSPGTELAVYSGAPALKSGTIYPRTVGYLNVAQVLATGSEVSSCKIGDFIISTQPHRSCFICKEDEALVVIAEGANLRSAAVTYLFHLGYDALLRAGYLPGHRIAVIGLGAVGLASVALANCFGARVTGFSDRKDSIALAKVFGAEDILPKYPGLNANGCDSASHDKVFDIVITTSNLWQDWLLALRLAKDHGTVCVLGFPGRGQPAPVFNPLDTALTYAKQLELIWCGNPIQQHIQDSRFSIKQNMAFLYNLIANEKLPAAKLVSEIRPWFDIESVYRSLLSQENGRLTYVLDWEQEPNKHV